jgi:transposase
VSQLKQIAQSDPSNDKYQNEFKRYLIVRKSAKSDTGVTVSIREDALENSLKNAGWFVLISNHIEDAQKAHDVYRMKDVVEKAFLKYKNNLGLDRLRVHSDERAKNKLLVAFIALVLASHIHSVMNDNQMYKNMSFDKLLISLSKIRSVTVNGLRSLRPITKAQNDILKAFGIIPPKNYTSP